MKKIILLSLGAALTFLNFKCDEEGVVIDFNYTHGNIEFKVDPLPAVGEQDFASNEIDLKIDSIFAKNNISKETLKGAKITTMTFVITAPNNANFNAIDNIEAYISAPSAGLTDILVAKTPSPMPQDAQSIEMVVEGDDLAPYIKANIIKLTVRGKNNAPIEEQISMKASMSFTMSGQVL